MYEAYEWDQKKSLHNKKKHGISFEAAVRIFAGPVLTRIDDREDYGEERWISLGQVANTAVIVVAHTDRDGRTRIISARRATRREREIYYESLKETSEGIQAAFKKSKDEEAQD